MNSGKYGPEITPYLDTFQVVNAMAYITIDGSAKLRILITSIIVLC